MKITYIPTVLEGEFGPHGKLGPHNTWLNEIGFFLLKVIAIIHQHNSLLKYIYDFVKLLSMYYCNCKQNPILLSQVLWGPSLPWGPSSPAFTVHCFHICDTKCTYEDTAVQPAR